MVRVQQNETTNALSITFPRKIADALGVKKGTNVKYILENGVLRLEVRETKPIKAVKLKM